MIYRLSPHLQLDDDYIKISSISCTDIRGQTLSGNWKMPEAVRVSTVLLIPELTSLRKDCGLPKTAPMRLVMTAAGASVRSRVVLCESALQQSGEMVLTGEIPVGYADEELRLSVSLELSRKVSTRSGAASNKGDVLWSQNMKHLLGDAKPLVRVVKEDLSKRGLSFPWMVEADLSDLDRSFTEAVRIVVNSSHKLGKVIEVDQRHWGMQSLHKTVESQMMHDIDRQLLVLGISDERVRDLPVDEHNDSLGAVLRRRLHVLLRTGTLSQQYDRFLADPLSIEREMVRTPE